MILIVDKSVYKLFTHLVPVGCPLILRPFIFIVELVSIIIRPITLSVRLIANMVAGHLILTILGDVFSMLSYFLGGWVCGVLLITLETAVAFIQAYVLVILCVLYISES